MAVESISFEGWPDHRRVSNDPVEFILIQNVIPRITAYQGRGGDRLRRCAGVMVRRSAWVGCLLTLFVSGCTTTSPVDSSRAAMNQAIANEPAGNYFIGRRFYRRSYFFWGYVRKPQKPWVSAELVMLNEQKVHAPDRAANAIGYDNNYEYRLEGYFSGDRVYEPASNQFYPEFVVTRYQQITASPLPIFRDVRAGDPNRLVIDKPE